MSEPKKSIAEPAQFRMVLVSFLAGGIGLIAGLIAVALYRLIGLFTNLFFYHRWSVTLAVPSSIRWDCGSSWCRSLAGSLSASWRNMAAPRSKATESRKRWKRCCSIAAAIQPRVAILKPISAAIAFGTGGPFGAEGPIIQTGGAIGSLIGQVFHTTASERKVLLACGAAAGMSATFNTPIAGVILAIELLLFEFKSRSFIPLVIASTLATAVHMQLLGAGPMFTVSADGLWHSTRVAILFNSWRNLRVGRSGVQQSALLGRKTSLKSCRWMNSGGRRLGFGSGTHRIFCASSSGGGLRHPSAIS